MSKSYLSADSDSLKIFDAEGIRLTDCCGCYSSYYCGDEIPVLVCKKCYEEVPIGQGDGNESKTLGTSI